MKTWILYCASSKRARKVCSRSLLLQWRKMRLIKCLRSIDHPTRSSTTSWTTFLRRKRTEPILVCCCSVLAVAVVYAGLVVAFDFVLGQAIPKSLMAMFMFFVLVGVLMVFTFTEDGARELVAPIRAVVEDPARKRVRNVVFVIVPLAAGAFAFGQAQPSFEAPLELRAIHPAPPSSVELYGKRYDPLSLENPYRELEKGDPEQFRPYGGHRGSRHAAAKSHQPERRRQRPEPLVSGH